MAMDKILRNKLFQKLAFGAMSTMALTFVIGVSTTKAAPAPTFLAVSLHTNFVNSASNKIGGQLKTNLIFPGSSIAQPANSPDDAKTPYNLDYKTANGSVTVATTSSNLVGNSPIFDNGIVEKHIACYPNPAISYINFKFDKTVQSSSKLAIFSFTGRKMEEFNITGSIIKVSLTDYFRGLYVYQLRDANGAILESGKFQIKK